MSNASSTYEQLLEKLSSIQRALEVGKAKDYAFLGPRLFRDDYEKEYLDALETHSSELSKLSVEQIGALAECLSKRPGFTLRRLEKARLFGLRELPRSVFRLDALTREMWDGLPERDKRTFRKNAGIPTLSRGACVLVKPDQLSNEAVRFLIDSFNPHKGILTVAEQIERKRKTQRRRR